MPAKLSHILGSGSIGLFLAARSAKGSATLLLRNHHRPRLREGKVQIKVSRTPTDGSDKSPTKLYTTAAQIISDLSPHEHIRQLILTTKAFDALSAIQSVEQHLFPQTYNNDSNQVPTSILVLCNGGLAVRQELQDYFQQRQQNQQSPHNIPSIHIGSVTHGVYRQPDDTDTAFSIVHAGVGRIFVPDTVTIHHLQWPGVTTVSHDDMEGILWQKLAANSVCNPLTALYQCTNGALAGVVPQFDQVLYEIVSEMVQVQHAVAQKTPLDVDATVEFVQQVILDNAENRSSMQQDVYYQRRTEIDYLNHYTVETGRQYGIECPRNAKLVEQIRNLEATFATGT